MKFLPILRIVALLSIVLPASQVVAADKVQIVRTPNNGAVPDAETGHDGTLHIAYVSGSDVFYTNSTDNGATFSRPLRVNSTPASAGPPAMFRGPDLALGADNTVHVIWYTNAYQRKLPKDQWGVYYSRLLPSSAAFEPERNLNHAPSDNFSIAAGPQGAVAVFWMANGLFTNLSRDNGQTFATAEKVPPANTCECCASRAMYGSDGTLFCAYRDKTDNQRDMFLLTRRPGPDDWTRSLASGTPWRINACPMTGTFLAGTSTGPVMAWETKGAISFAHFDATGNKQGAETVVTGSGGKYPVVLTAPDGVTCVSWKAGGALHWRLYSANGSPLGEESSQPSPNTARHAGVLMKNNDFLLID